MKRLIMVAIVTASMMAVAVPAAVAGGKPTCGGVVGQVHGQHVVGDYVTGVGHDDLEWPPAGQANAAGGAVLPGGPGPAFHFVNDFAPGASFCNSQAKSPGFHIPG